MFFKTEDIGGITQIRVFNPYNNEYISIIPELGGMLNGLGLSKNGVIHELLNNSQDYQTVVNEGIPEYKGTKLFPFPNRIDKGEYTFEENHYQLEKNHVAEGHAIHGLVYKTPFEMESFENINKGSQVFKYNSPDSKFHVDSLTDSNKGMLTLKYTSNGEENGYPFLYELKLQYILSSNGFKCITTVENKDNRVIPVGDGWHPYFSTGSVIDDMMIRIPSSEYLELDSNKIPTGRVMTNNDYLNLKLLDKTVFDTCFKLPVIEGIQTIELYDPQKDVRISIWQETGLDKYNFVQIYTHPSRKSIAIEPMSCMPDSFNNKCGLIMLLPGEKRKFTYGVKLM